MIDHDRLFKELLTEFFGDFIDLFLPELSGYLEKSSLVFLDKEVFTNVTSGERHEADLVARARFCGQDSCFWSMWKASYLEAEPGPHALNLRQQLVIRLLQRRCGTLPPPLVARLRALSLTEMESLAEALLDFTNLADLENWLARH